MNNREIETMRGEIETVGERTKTQCQSDLRVQERIRLHAE